MEAQLAKRLGRAKDAADAAAPLDAQQRAEQELYGVPENLKVTDLGSADGSTLLPRGGPLIGSVAGTHLSLALCGPHAQHTFSGTPSGGTA